MTFLITKFCNSSIIPAFATGTVAGVGLAAYPPIFLNYRISNFDSYVDVKELLEQIPKQVWFAGMAVGGAIGFSAATTYEVYKKIFGLKKPGQHSSSMKPAVMTGAVMGGLIAAEPWLIVHGANFIFEKTNMNKSIPDGFSGIAFNIMRSMILSVASVTLKEVAVGVISGATFGAAITVIYNLAKAILSFRTTPPVNGTAAVSTS